MFKFKYSEKEKPEANTPEMSWKSELACLYPQLLSANTCQMENGLPLLSQQLVSWVANTSILKLIGQLKHRLFFLATVSSHIRDVPLMRIVAGKANSMSSSSLGRNFIILKSKSVRFHSVSIRQPGCEWRSAASGIITVTHAQSTLTSRCCGEVCLPLEWCLSAVHRGLG